MAKSKIFVEETGGGRYPYIVVAAQGEGVRFYKDRFSKAELETIAKEMEAELLFIKTEQDIAVDEEEIAPEGEEPEDVE